MTIKDLAETVGVSHQAIYKRLKKCGVSLTTLKDKKSGHFTPEGEQKIREIFSLYGETKPVENSSAESAGSPPKTRLNEEVAELTQTVEKLKETIAELRNHLSAAEAKAAAFESERDYLRVALENSQKLQAITASKIPAALSGPTTSIGGGLRAWWQKVRRKPEKKEAETGVE